MPPKRATAKAAAKAKAQAKRKANLAHANRRRAARRRAVKSLNALAVECGAEQAQVDAKEARPAEMERLVRILEGRMNDPTRLQQLRDVAKEWLAHGGTISKPLLEEDHSRPPNVSLHRVLQTSYELKSKAFMTTYNSRPFIPSIWPAFRDINIALKTKFGRRAWGACLEKSEAAAAQDVYHLHGYHLWTDGVGVHCRSLDDFHFQGVRPRIDVCVSRLSTRSPHSAALHGLWYVAIVKNGTIHADTNYPAGVWYKPQAQWLQNLYQDGKLSYEKYVEYSAKGFPVGHAARKRDADGALRDLRHIQDH